MFRGGSGAFGVVAITGGSIGLDDGLVGTPSLYRGADSTTGFYFSAGAVRVTIGGVQIANVTGTALAGTALAPGLSGNSFIATAGSNQVRFAAGATSIVTSRTEINAAITAFTNAAAKTVLTITIPNAAHSASILVRVTGSLGAGGAIGANEATATNCYVVSVTRTAGVNATAAISAAFGAAATAVAGAATVTCTAALAAVSGAVGATNTIDIQATISRSGGSSDNHTAVVTASLLNANAAGITIA